MQLPDPTTACSRGECLEMVHLYADGYPLSCGWQQCLELVLPKPPAEVHVAGISYRHCLALLVDDADGAHFVFADDDHWAEVPLSEMRFDAPLSRNARLWQETYTDWHQRLPSPWKHRANASSASAGW